MTGTGVFLCTCNKDLNLDFKAIAKNLKKEDVKIVEVADLLCKEKDVPYLTQHLRWTDDRKPERVVIGACSKKKGFFEEVMKAHDMGEDELEVVNIREHCSWVHDDKKEATQKALALIKNVLHQDNYYPEPIEVKANSNVLLVGGINAIRATKELLKMGATVHLVPDEGYIRKDCDLCRDSQFCEPPHRTCLYDTNELSVHSASRVVGVNGNPGAFQVELEQDKHVDVDACIECGRCVEACGKNAIGHPKDSISNIYLLDPEKCDDCEECIKACPVDAIRLEGGSEVLDVGRIISFSESEVLAPREGVYVCDGDGLEAYKKAQAATLEATVYLADVVKEQVLDTNPELCANFRLQGKKIDTEGCVLCSNSCSYGAISSGEVDNNSCRYCGVCVGVCPQGVSKWVECPESVLYEQMEVLSEAKISPKVLMFYCSDCGEAALGAAGANKVKYPTVLPLKVTCLGSVSESHLLRALDLGFEGVLLAGCAGKCSHGTGINTSSKNIAHAKKLLKVYDIEDSRIKMIKGEAEEPEKFAQSIDKFVTNLKQLKATKLQKAESVELSIDKKTSERAVLLAILQGFSEKTGVNSGTIEGDYPFGDVLIDTQKCTLCSACANYCSTGALKGGDMPKTDGWVPEVTFTHTNCIACGICEDICPENALSVKKVLDLERFVSETGEEIKVELTYCNKCGRPIMAKTAFSRISDTLKEKEQEIPKFCRDCRDKEIVSDLLGIDADSEDFKIIEQGKSIFDHNQ